METLIFGKTWEEIQQMQQKTYIPKIAKDSKPLADSKDIELLNTKGIEYLKANQLFGVIDRLANSGLVDETSVFQNWLKEV